MHVRKHLPSRGQFSLFQQLHNQSRFSVVDNTLKLCCLITLNMLLMQLPLNFSVFLLKHTIPRDLPNMINKRLSDLSCNEVE